MRLRPVQAVALYEAMEVGGLFGPIRVGGGKSIIFWLLPLVLEAKRPVQFVPAALLEKTWRDYQALKQHWRLPTNVQLLSHESLGLVQSAQKLEYIRPDFIGVDEAHMLKNFSAARTKRVARYMREHPETRVACASGTFIGARVSVKHFAHILRWCLKDRAPIPLTDEETDAWADALDEKVNPLGRRSPGALFLLGPAQDGDELACARRVFQDRLLDTPGVVASPRSDRVSCSLRVQPLEYDAGELSAQYFDHVRQTKTTPSGYGIAEPALVKMYLRQIALGFHSRWRPAPPQAWLDARREWASYVREVLVESDSLDSELQVANAVDAGRLRTGTLSAWRQIRDTFAVNAEDVWHDDAAIQACARWMERERGIVWCPHTFFARRLARETGAPYYGAEGRTDAGESIVDVKAGAPIICSVKANSEGRNLQMFSRNLVTSWGPSAKEAEQLIGRTHRDGQEADEVVVDVLVGCREHLDAFDRSLEEARATADLLGHDQKLLVGDLCLSDIKTETKTGPLWRRT
jgi:hypothetical protein